MIHKTSISIKKSTLIKGLILLVIGIFAPSIVDYEDFSIYKWLYESIETGDTGKLIIAAINLIIMNCIRGVPQYLGAFILAESISIRFNNKPVQWTSGLVPIVIIPSVYYLIFKIYNIKYDLGIPSLMVILSILLLEKVNYSTVKPMNKSFIIVLLLFGVQWLDVVPALSRYGFGKGELSQEIKLVAAFMDSGYVITLIGVMFFIIFTLSSFLISKILNDEHKYIMTEEKNKAMERELQDSRIRALEARTMGEMRSIVHDLKTPLSSIQSLASIINIVSKNKKIKKYSKRIEKSVDQLNSMITEILYPDKRRVISIEELMDYVLSENSPHMHSRYIVYKNEAGNRCILANKIQLTRAIINVLENAYYAIDKEKGHIRIHIKYEKMNVYIIIEDDGIGIDEAQIDKVFEMGFSTKGSTGLGMNFVKRVVDSHDGQISISSKLNQGTTVVIAIPEVKCDDKKYKNIGYR